MPYMVTMTVSEARARLPEVLDRVEAGEEITITRHGRPAAVVVSPSRAVRRNPAAQRAIEEGRKIGEAIREAGRRPLSEMRGLAPGEADRLVAELGAERDTY
jgi:prevent-host-death family protein